MSLFNDILKRGKLSFNAFGGLEDGGRHVNVRVHLQEFRYQVLEKCLSWVTKAEGLVEGNPSVEVEGRRQRKLPTK